MSSINAQADMNFARFILKAKSALQDVTKMVLVDFGARLVNRSPVGDPPSWKRQPAYVGKNYVPGRFKNNWQLGVDGVPNEVFYVSDRTGEASKLRIAKAIPRWPVGHVYYFTNNLPYARELELGHSRQCPPGGMVALTKMEFHQIVRDAEQRYAGGERPVRKADL